MIHGQLVDYTAVAGTMVVDTEGGKCEIFFTAYTVEDGGDAARRPLTFVFNGGPGSSSEWMHMGFLGPRRIVFDDDGQPTQFPAAIGDNEYSVLDMTDLVFIDPVGTGYSRPAEGAELKNFIGYENDNWTLVIAKICRRRVLRHDPRDRNVQVPVREIRAGTERYHAHFFGQRLYHHDGADAE